MKDEAKDRSFSKFASQGLKGVAIMLMMLHHCFLGRDRWEGYTVSFYPLGEARVAELANFGKICVAIFVFISAFGITKSYLKVMKSGDLSLKKQVYPKTAVNRLFKLLWGFWGSFAVWQVFSLVNNHFEFTRNTHNFATVYGTSARSVLYFFTDAMGLAELFKTPTFNGTWWYMSLAVVIILVMPLLIELYNKFGIITVLIAPLLPQFLGIEKNYFTRYLFIIMLGIWSADKNILEKLYELKLCKNIYVSKGLKFIISLALLVLCIKVRQYDGGLLAEYVEVMDAVIPFFVIYFCYEFLVFTPVFKQVLQFVGKYSTTIFLTHTFIRAYYFQDFIYSFKNWALIVLMLLLSSLLYAVIYDNIVKKLGYYKLCDKIIKRFNERFEKTNLVKGD